MILEFIKDRNALPADELAQYAGQHVARSPDGNRILAADEGPRNVLATLQAARYDTGEALIEAVPLAEESSSVRAMLALPDSRGPNVDRRGTW